MTELMNRLKLTSNGTEACRVLIDACFSDSVLSDSQFSVLVDMFGEPDLASHALLHLHSMMVVEDMWEMNEVYNVLYEKFVSASPEMVTILNPSIIA